MRYKCQCENCYSERSYE